MDKNVTAQKYPKHNYLNFSLRTIMAFIGVSLVGLGAALMREGHVGLDPFTALNAGMSNHLGIELGSYQLLANLFIFILVLIFNRKQIGLGTIINMILVGYEIQWFSDIYEKWLNVQLNFFVIIVDGLVGLLLFTLGTSVYMSSKLGVAPYDAIAPIISQKFHIKYQRVRTIQDILFMIAGFFAGGPFGLMTIITAFFAGPLITLWNRNVSDIVMDHIQHFSDEPTMNNVENGVVGFSRQGYIWLHQAYRATIFMQKHLSGYSNQELEELINENNRHLKQNLLITKNLEKFHRSLAKEARRRKINQKLSSKTKIKQ